MAGRLVGESPSLVGRQLSPYQILSLIGSGGMGEVYKAKDTRIGREVAIKVLAPTFTAQLATSRRFEQEVRAAGRVKPDSVQKVLPCRLLDVSRRGI
jgi:serine/threonine protein kinase